MTPPELFETLRTYDGAPALLDQHLARLGAADDDALRRRVLELVDAAEGDVVVRIVDREVELRPLPEGPATPLAVTTAEVPGYAYPQKLIERSLHDRLLSSSTGAFDVLILDAGEVIEGTRTNVFVLKGDNLLTPPLGRCLPGITRMAVLELAASVGLQATEQPLTLDDLRDADELLLTNSLRGIVRVGTLDGSAVGGRNIECHQQLSDALLAHCREQA